MKPVTMAPMDRNALTLRQRSVNSMIPAAANSGRNKINQVSNAYIIGYSFIVVRSSTCAVWRLR